MDNDKSTNTIVQTLAKELVSHGFKVKISLDKDVIDADLVIGIHSNNSGEVLIIKDDKSFSRSGRLACSVAMNLLEYYNCTILSNKEIGRSFTCLFTRTKAIPTMVFMYGSHRDKDNEIYASLLADALKQLKNYL
jgi:hypothetical protein